MIIKPLLFCLFCFSTASFAQTNALLSLQGFVELAMGNDTEFEEILIAELELAYQKELRMPARDLVLSVKEEYVSFFEDSRGEAATSISLSKAFPKTATDIELAYDVRPSSNADRGSPAGVSLTLSQAIARNAFGRSTRMLDQLIGVEVEVARHQIIEAYEDYLARLMGAYYQWWSAYEDLQISKKSYRENSRLLDNILERQNQQVALPIDVNKIRLQLLGKKEDLVEHRSVYNNALHEIERSIRWEGETPFIPMEDQNITLTIEPFDKTYEEIQQSSRTFIILDLLEERSDINLDRTADDLLPSLDLLFGLETEGEEHNLEQNESLISLGIALRWPFPNEVKRARYEVAEIEVERQRLMTANTEQRIGTRLRNLYEQIKLERELTAIAEEQIELAQAIVRDETENYSYGRVTLNDYIRAVNTLDGSRFSRLRHAARAKILSVEWLRLADRLVGRSKQSGPAAFSPRELDSVQKPATTP